MNSNEGHERSCAMCPDELKEQVKAIEVSRVDFYPIIRAYIQRLGLVELINSLIPTQMEVQPGLIVAGMIQDTFSGRSPLYRLEEFFKTQDTELLLGTYVEPDAFKDYNVGRVMDRIYETGASRIFSEVSYRAAIIFNLDLSQGHWDSTSVSVWGDYDFYSNEDDPRLKITFGHSKNLRPDLKQFMISMLCVENNIPILGDCHDGNSSDKTLNNKLLTRISKDLAKHGLGEGAFTYVADSALVSEENLACFKGDGIQRPMYFVTRLPFTYNETDRCVKEAVRADQWKEIGVLARSLPTRKRPVASYRGYESEVELYGTSYRAVVIHSSAHDKRRNKRIDRELKQERNCLMEEIQRSNQITFYCEADALSHLDRLKALSSPYYRVDGQITEIPVYGRGRPSKSEPRKIIKRHWQIKATILEKADAVAKKREEAGCFVLLTNRPAQGEDAQSAEDLLRSYKAQDGIERNYSFLKDPLIVNDLFLKKPERIEALGMILLICLLIWNLMQRSMRLYVEKTGTTVEGWKGKPTDRPTSFMMTTKFQGLQVVRVGHIRLLKPGLTQTQKNYLLALGVSEMVFTDPRPG